MGRDSSVSIATRYGLTVRGSNPGGGETFRTRSERSWNPPSLLYNGYRTFPGVKRPGCGVDHPPNLAPRLKKEYSYTSIPPLGLRGLFLGEPYLHLYHYDYYYYYYYKYYY